ncbi:hypothetical protein Q3G72_018552 [Acer saccharum]|nr:hypothetical protein Q3G72_018552 [Acer saccharum]
MPGRSDNPDLRNSGSQRGPYDLVEAARRYRQQSTMARKDAQAAEFRLKALMGKKDKGVILNGFDEMKEVGGKGANLIDENIGPMGGPDSAKGHGSHLVRWK